MSDERLIFSHADAGVVPESLTVPWTKTGAGVVSVTSGRWRFTTTGAALYYSVNAFDSDRVDSKPRIEDVLEMQVRLQGVSQLTDGIVGFWMGDGSRHLAVSLGASLKIVSPTSYATVYYTPVSAWSFTAERVLHLIKWGSEYWEIRVDGVTAAIVPYALAPTMAPAAAYFAFGQLTSGTASALWEYVETGLNLQIPPQGKVDRLYNDMPTAWRDVMTPAGRGLLRTITGLFERGIALRQSITRSLSGGRYDVATYAIPGDITPANLEPAWVASSATISVVRERVRFTAAASTPRVRTAQLAALDSTAEWYVRGRFTVRSYTPGASSEVGPAIIIDDGTRQAWIALREYPASTTQTAWTWQVGSAVGTAVSTRYFHVGALGEMLLEVQVLGGNQLVLLVDEQIVDTIPYSSLGSSGAGGITARTITVGAASAMTSTFDVWDLQAGTRIADHGARPLQAQVALEDVAGWGGGEENDHLNTWTRYHYSQQEMRGRERGIKLELERLANTRRVYIRGDINDAEWILDSTWPDITPIWLDMEGTLSDLRVEFYRNCPNFTAQELACFAWRYLVPRSVLEARYTISNIVAVTSGITSGSGVSIAVESIVPGSDFEVGDEVLITSFDNTASEEVIITGMSANTIIVDSVVGTYAHAADTPPLIVRHRASTFEPVCGYDMPTAEESGYFILDVSELDGEDLLA